MRRLLVVLSVLWLLPSAAFAAPKIKVDKPAPGFSLPDTHGKKHDLSQYKGKVVVLEWLNHGCPFVKKHYNSGNMQALQKKYRDKGVVWLSIVSSAPGKQGYYSPEEANKINASKKGHANAILLDPEGKVGQLYSARTTPHMYIIDAKGTLVYMGAIDSIRSTNPEDTKKAKNFVSAALDAVLAGKAVDVKKTRPYGCSVKYKSSWH
ncbi:MAG: thioredoxin family protein [Myxococcales bacterium]|nr:thioredoxin family protein [Myxococcales bacterium]